MAKSLTYRAAACALPLLFLMAGGAAATLLVEENFDYATGQLTTVSGNQWVVYSSGTPIQVMAGNLSYPSYASSNIGNLIRIKDTLGTAEDAYRQFATQTAGSSVYVSFLARVNDAGTLPESTSTNGDYFACLLPPNSISFAVGRVCAKKGPDAGTFRLGLRINSSSAASWHPAAISIDSTILVVLKYVLVPGSANDSCYMWVNPAIGVSEPAPEIAQVSTAADSSTIARLAIRQAYYTGTTTPNADIDGIRAGTNWSDISGLNPSGPNVVSVSPANQAGGVPANAAISVTFDRLVDGATVNASSFLVTGVRQPAYPPDSIRPSGNSASFTYYVSDSLRAYDTVTVTLTTAIVDTHGENLANEYSWWFTTLAPDTVRPIVESTVPSDGQGYVPANTTIEINFSEPLLPATVAPASFGIAGRRVAQYQIEAVTLSNGDRRVSLQPLDTFSYRDTITVSILSAVTDTSGNAVSDTSFSFSTKTHPGLTIRDVQYTEDPTGNSPLAGQNVTVAGVVTGVVRAGNSRGMYFIQDGKGPWNGVYCYDRDRFPSEGDSVLVGGTVIEYYGLTEISPVSSFSMIKKGARVPDPVVLPTCSLSALNANAEAYEGVLVATKKVTVTTTPNTYYEWEVDDGSGPCINDDFLDSLSHLLYSPAVGDSLARVQGIFHSSYGWKILPRLIKDIVQFKPVRFLSSMPSGGMANVPTQVGIRLEFDKPLDPATLVPANFAVTGSLGGSYPLAVAYDSLNYLVTLKAQPALTPGETVSVWVSYALRDTFGWYLDGNGNGVGSNDSTDQVRFSFTTLLNPTRIADVQRPGPDGFTPVLVGQTVTVEGVVTGPASIISSSTSSTASSYIQDASGGVNLYGGSKSDFDLGRRVVATGVVTEYNGVTEVAASSSDVSVWDLADSLPRPKTMIYNQFPTESIEGLLIDFDGIVNAPPAYAGGGYNLEVRNGDATVALRYGEASGFDNSVLLSGTKVHVTGIVSQYDKEPPYSTGYQIIPRFPEAYGFGGRVYPADIEVISDLTTPSDSPEILGVSPNPFSPDLGEVAWMELNAPATDRLTLRIYDLKGRLVRTCLNNAPGGHQTYPWNGKDDMGKRANIGIYIAHLRSVSAQGGKVDRTKLVVMGTPLN